MQAPTTPATLTLADGKKRVLRFSNAALKKIKAQYHTSVMRDGVQKLLASVDEDQLSELLVLGFDHKQEGGEPGITVEQIDDILDAQNTKDALSQVIEALGNSVVKNVLALVEQAMANAQAAAKKKEAEATTPPPPVPPATPETPITPTTIM